MSSHVEPVDAYPAPSLPCQVNLAFTSMAFTAVAARCARTRAPFRALRRARPVPGSMAVVGSPTETYEELVQTSVKLRDESWQKRHGAVAVGFCDRST